MTRIPILTDELLRRAIAPDDELLAPPDLLDAIADGVRRTPQRTGVVEWWRQVATLRRDRLAWSLVAGAGILALLAGLVLSGGGPKPRPAVVEPTAGPAIEPTVRGAITAELEVGEGDFPRVLGVDREEAWVTSFGGRLWHRTVAGWHGPERTGTSDIRGLGRLPDGRVVVTGDHGVRLRDDVDQWTELSPTPSSAATVDADGTIWVARRLGLDAYRSEGGLWSLSRVNCHAGGQLITQASDGSVWTGGIGYSGAAGLARWDGSHCEPVFPQGEGVYPEVAGLAAGPNGEIAIAIAIAEPKSATEWSGRILLWDGTTWTTIRNDGLASPLGIAFDSRGDLYTAGIPGDLDTGDPGGIWRYSGGTWTQVIEDATWTPWTLSVAPDDTLWYEAQHPDGSRTIERIAVGDLPR
jgi:hypothetical protein